MRNFPRIRYRSRFGKPEIYFFAISLLLLFMSAGEAKTLQKLSADTNINLIHFDQEGWDVKRKSAEEILLERDRIEIHVSFVDEPAPFVKDQIENQRLHKQIQESLAEREIGLMNFEIKEVNGVTCRIIHTKEIQSDPGATRYTSSIQLPVQGKSCIITVSAREKSPTGRRSALVLTRLMKAGEVSFNRETADLDNWYVDPYDSKLAGLLVRNKAELEQYDDIFPDHALTLVRKTVHNIVNSLKIDRK